MQRSSHLIDLSIASFIRCVSGDVVAMTSSSCMIISDPILFCRDIECSGVRSLEFVLLFDSRASIRYEELASVNRHEDSESAPPLPSLLLISTSLPFGTFPKPSSYQQKPLMVDFFNMSVLSAPTHELTHRYPLVYCLPTLAKHARLLFFPASLDQA